MKPYQIALFAVLILSGCDKPEEEDPIETCPKPEFSISSNENQGSFSYYVNSNNSYYGFYEIQYGSNGFSLGNGITETVNSSAVIGNLTNGTYDAYLRGNCGGNDWSDWQGPKSVFISGGNSSTCSAPSNLEVNYYSYKYNLDWSNTNSEADYFEVEFGPSGFEQGTGTQITTSSSHYVDGSFTKGTTYDFYVRSNCGGNDWSPWAGPESFYADYNANRCLKPISVTGVRYSGRIDLTVVPDGEDYHEVSFNNFSNGPDLGDIDPITSTTASFTGFSSSYTYYIYVRSVCDDGQRTDWTRSAIAY